LLNRTAAGAPATIAQFLPGQSQVMVIVIHAAGLVLNRKKGGIMKTKQKIPMMEARTVAVLVGLAIGLEIAVHEVFFLVALGIVLVAAAEWTAQRTYEFLREFRSSHRYQ
jgi:hypothetical protein